MSKHYPASKLPTIKTIRHAARTLMQIHEAVTSAEVKNYLSRQGYSVNHCDIVYWMNCLAKEEEWQSEFDGRLREYRPKASPAYDLCCEALGFSSN